MLAVFAALLLLPLVQASPTISDPSSSVRNVGASVFPTVPSNNHFTFGTGLPATAGTVIRLFGPAGESMSFTKNSATPGTASLTQQIWGLDGVHYQGDNSWTVSGSLLGKRADGTWRVDVEAVGGYSSDVLDSGATNDRMRLLIERRQITFSANQNNPSTLMQYFTWTRIADDQSWSEPSTRGADENLPITPALVDAPCEGIDFHGYASPECPTDFIFFKATTGQSSPLGATGQSVISCSGTAASTFTLTGTWKHGASQTANTFVRFVFVPGNVAPPAGDLRTNPLATLTPQVDAGGGSSAVYTSPSQSPYNNAVGHTYQMLTRSGAAGIETFSNPVFISKNACAVSTQTILNLVRDESSFAVSVSQAQCAGDPVSFTISEYLLGAGTGIGATTLTLYESLTGSPVFTITNANMHQEGAFPNLIYSTRLVMPAGAWTALATADLTGGLGVKDFFDAAAFSVPVGTCKDSPTDLSTVLNSISTVNLNQTTFHNNDTAYLNHLNSHLHLIDANITTFHNNETTYLNHLNAHLHYIQARINQIDSNLNASRQEILESLLNLNITLSGNLTIDNSTLNEILHQIIEHRNDPLELNGMPLEISSPIFLALLIFSLIIAWAEIRKEPILYLLAVLTGAFEVLGLWPNMTNTIRTILVLITVFLGIRLYYARKDALNGDD